MRRQLRRAAWRGGLVVLLVVSVVAMGLLTQPRGYAQSAGRRVFPSAEGFGSTTRAAYGGTTPPTVLRVVNLDDSGTGSLRAAVEAMMPRVVIFETSGTIVLKSDLYVRSPYLTIAGATAPSPGVTVRGYGITVESHDVLVQHLRIRVGDEGPRIAENAGYDGLIAYTADAYNIVVDHCSISWAGGESTAAGSAPEFSNVTYSWNIISEALHFPKNIPENSHGMLIYSGTKNVAAIGNLFAHNVERNPEVQEDTRALIINNVMYDWGQTDQINYYAMALLFYNAGRITDGGFSTAVIGNKFIKGPGSPSPRIAIQTYSANPGSQVYLSDNATDGAVTDFVNTLNYDPRVGSSPIPLDGITIRPSASIEELVLAQAGARPADRDDVDKRVVSEVQNRTGHYLASQQEVGGWPVLKQNTRRLTLPASPDSLRTSGYTALEEWLQDFAAVVEGRAPTPRSLRVSR